MKTNRTQKWIGAGMFAFLMFFASAGFSLTAKAQYPQDDRYRNQNRRGVTGITMAIMAARLICARQR